MTEPEEKKKWEVVISEQAMQDIIDLAQRCDEEGEIDTIEMREFFRKFMDGADEIRVFADGCFEWKEDDGSVRQASWMDLYFSRDGHWTSPLCVVAQAFIKEENALQARMKSEDAEWEVEEYKDNEWDMSIDDEYLTKDNMLDGVRKWIEKYHPHLAHLPIVHEDEEVAKEMLDRIWKPIREKVEKARKDIEEGRTYTLEEMKGVLKDDDEDI